MTADLPTLLRRDHADLHAELTQLLDPEVTIADLRTALDGVRLGLTAHAEAEDIVLAPLERLPALEQLIRDARGAHRIQAATMQVLVASRPQTPIWRQHVHQLRGLIAYHASKEELTLLPGLRRHAPVEVYAELAGAFATQRLRQLAMLQPSAPMRIPALDQVRAY